jgi:outer membrane immunogenic protein
MKRLATAVAAIALIGTPALAADMAVKMPVKAPPPPPAPVYSWTGWYVGGNVGYSWGSASNDFAFSQSSKNSGNLPPFWTFNGSEREHLDGVIGGGQAGYNWQTGTFLYGIETDIQGSAEKHTGNFNGILLDPGVGVGNNPFTVTETNRIDWFGTVRGRIGLTNDHWLFYATGGLAYGRVESSGIFQPAGPANSPFVWNNSATKVGWTIGAGVENVFFGNWSWRVEYLYMDLGKLTGTVSGGVLNCLGAPGGGICNILFIPGTLTVTSHFTDNIVRVGLNYQFH